MAAPGPHGTMQDRRTPLPVRALSRREQASVPLIRYRLTSRGEDSSGKEGFQLAGDRRRQFRFQEIKHHEHRLLGALMGDPCFRYNQVYYFFIHSELSARA